MSKHLYVPSEIPTGELVAAGTLYIQYDYPADMHTYDGNRYEQ